MISWNLMTSPLVCLCVDMERYDVCVVHMTTRTLCCHVYPHILYPHLPNNTQLDPPKWSSISSLLNLMTRKYNQEPGVGMYMMCVVHAVWHMLCVVYVVCMLIQNPTISICTCLYIYNNPHPPPPSDIQCIAGHLCAHQRRGAWV